MLVLSSQFQGIPSSSSISVFHVCFKEMEEMIIPLTKSNFFLEFDSFEFCRALRSFLEKKDPEPQWEHQM